MRRVARDESCKMGSRTGEQRPMGPWHLGNHFALFHVWGYEYPECLAQFELGFSSLQYNSSALVHYPSSQSNPIHNVTQREQNNWNCVDWWPFLFSGFAQHLQTPGITRPTKLFHPVFPSYPEFASFVQYLGSFQKRRMEGTVSISGLQSLVSFVCHTCEINNNV